MIGARPRFSADSFHTSCRKASWSLGSELQIRVLSLSSGVMAAAKPGSGFKQRCRSSLLTAHQGANGFRLSPRGTPLL